VGVDRIAAFLEDLAVRGQVSASTQNQALNALAFLYQQVLGQPLGDLAGFARAKRPKRLPVVLERGEVFRLLERLEGVQHLMAALLYGTGMRLIECVRLRVQDVDFHYHQILVRDGKGQKHRRADARRAIRHSASHPWRRILSPDARPTGRHRGPGKWRNRYRVPPYAGLRRGVPPGCIGPEVAQCAQRMDLAIRLSERQALGRSPKRHDAPPSYA